jgi:GNAT superfamily N-acetyltransferase
MPLLPERPGPLHAAGGNPRLSAEQSLLASHQGAFAAHNAGWWFYNASKPPVPLVAQTASCADSPAASRVFDSLVMLPMPSDTDPSIRPASVEDAAAIAHLWLTCTAEVAANEPIYTPAITAEDLASRLRSEFGSGAKFGFVAEVDGHLAGYVTCEIQDESPVFVPRRYVYVCDLDVAPEHRGRGLSRVLMREVEREAAHRGISRLELAVAYGDPRSRAVWERHGFQPHFLHLHKELEDPTPT